MAFDQTLPALLAELHQLDFEYDDGEGMDFEPYDQFFPAAENADWIRAWTGNQDLTGAEYRIFGQDGTGGYAALWLTRKATDLLDQPVVFFGSEGAVGVVAYDFADYLWLLASGVGPMEAIEYGPDDSKSQAEFTAFADERALGAKKTCSEVLARAAEAFPTFADDFLAQCR